MEQLSAKIEKILETADYAQTQRILAAVGYGSLICNIYSDERVIERLLDNFARALLNFDFGDQIVVEPKSPLIAKPCVYIVACGSEPTMYKVGATGNLAHRLRTIATSNPFKPQLIHVFYTSDPYSLESELHRQFSGKRTHGEWFEFSDEDVISVIDAAEALLKEMESEHD